MLPSWICRGRYPWLGKNKALGLEERIKFHPVNILDEHQQFPKGHDGIWMSQFLDCFSDEEITSIQQTLPQAIDENGYVFILEISGIAAFEQLSVCR